MSMHVTTTIKYIFPLFSVHHYPIYNPPTQSTRIRPKFNPPFAYTYFNHCSTSIHLATCHTMPSPPSAGKCFVAPLRCAAFSWTTTRSCAWTSRPLRVSANWKFCKYFERLRTNYLSTEKCPAFVHVFCPRTPCSLAKLCPLLRTHEKTHSTLNNNNLTTLPRDTFTGQPRIRALRLSDNPFACDCHLSWLSRFLRAAPRLAPYTRCHSPGQLKGQNVADLHDQEFKCSGEWVLIVFVIHSTITFCSRSSGERLSHLSYVVRACKVNAMRRVVQISCCAAKKICIQMWRVVMMFATYRRTCHDGWCCCCKLLLSCVVATSFGI